MAIYNNCTVKAYGKLNLMLDILGRCSNGYHLLNTVMQSISCYDLLKISLTDGSGIEIKCDKEDFPCDESNLIWKACTAFKESTNIDFGGKLVIEVEKNLPSMAGMGGGSADCAAMLGALNVMYGTFLEDEELCKIGGKLGADVPFCICGGTRLCQGIGEKTFRLPTPDCCFTVIKPDTNISTAEAYEKYDSLKKTGRGDLDQFLQALASNNIYRYSSHMYNALEDVSQNEEIEKAKEQLMKSGAVNAMMTGSGSAVFGIYTNKQSAEFACEQLGVYEFKEVCEPVKCGYEIVYKK